jgi:hypothetical protein
MNKIARLPLRKLAFIATIIFTFITTGLCLVWFGDVPPGTVNVLLGMFSVSGGSYALTSAYESVRTPPKWDDKGGEGQ